jgi:hypothetical protein
MHSGSGCSDSSGGAEVILLATGGHWQRRGLAAAAVAHLCAAVAAAAPGHPVAAYAAHAALPFWAKVGFSPPGRAAPLQAAADDARGPASARWCHARGMMRVVGTTDVTFVAAGQCAAPCGGAPADAAQAVLAFGQSEFFI